MSTRERDLTRMHSSRMRTGRSLTVCWSLLPGGVSAPGGVCSGGSAPGGVSAPRRGGVCSGGSAPGGYIPAYTEADTPPPCGQTDACENITLA